jgi:anti-sigma regulatory factor (Ser/Thr protein kinase)
MEAVRRIRLPLTVEAPSQARRWVLQSVEGLEPPAVEIVTLLLSELVANSVRHSGATADQDVDIRIETVDHGVHVEVRDPGRGRDIRPMVPPEHAGLMFVDALSNRWGVAHAPTTVWFDLAS